MARPKKDARLVSFKMAADVYDKLSHFCDVSGQSKTMAVERLLSKAIDEYFERPQEERRANHN